MKKIMLILTALLVVTALAGCGASEKVQEKAAEKAIEDAIGGKANVDIDGDKYTFEDNDGNKIEVGSNEWPTGEAADVIPKLDKGTITSVVNTAGNCVIDIDEVEKSDFDEYLQAIKDAGFTKNAAELKDANGLMYQATTDNGKTMLVSYSFESKHLQIMGGIGA